MEWEYIIAEEWCSNIVRYKATEEGVVIVMNGYDREISFEIVEQVGVLKEHSTGWRKELNLIRWNTNANDKHKEPVWDLRDWSPDHMYMSRGSTLTDAEMRKLMECMYTRRKTRKPLQERITEVNDQQKQEERLPQKGYEEAFDR